MDHYGILSVLPPVLAIALAIKTKQVYISLSVGIFSGYLILANWHPLWALHETFTALIGTFADASNTQTILFCLLMGALIAFSKKSGGIKGFVNYIDDYINKSNFHGSKKAVIIQLLAGFTGLIIFIETSISALTVGTLFRPLFEKMGLSKEKLAYIVDSSSAPASALIPFNAWGAFIMSLLVAQGIDAPFGVMLGALKVNLYPIITLLLLFTVVMLKLSFGPMRKYEKQKQEEMTPGASANAQNELSEMEPAKGVNPRSFNFIIPLITLVVTMPMYLILTGHLALEPGINSDILTIIGNGNGSLSVLYAVSTALLVGAILFKVQKIMKIREQVDVAFNGMGDLLPLGVLMVLAFMISGMCKELGTGIYIASVAKTVVHPALIPAIIFLLSAFIAFSTGTSWGTFAIMISIAIPLSTSFEINPSLVTAAVIGGGVFGDHCSPISDTTIISSLASGSDHINHVKTQIPYALIAGGLSLLGFLLLGLL